MKLIEDAKESWRFASVQATAAMGAISTLAMSYPDLIFQLTAMLGGTPVLQGIIALATVAIILLRVWDQGGDNENA